MPQKKLAQEVSAHPIHDSLQDRWCLSNLGGRGPANRHGLMYPIWVMRPVVPWDGSPPHSLPKNKHRSLETREERGPSDPCTERVVGVRLPSPHPIPPR